MDRAKKCLASALDGFRNQHKLEMDLEEKITAEDVCLTGIVRHGFPDDPRCMAYDTVQRLLAIGTGHGIVRVIGDIGVDYCLKHESDAAVLHLQFLMNEGALITACRDDQIHLWNLRQKVPMVLHSMRLTNEQITCISHPFQSKWLYLGTERGNVYFVSIATFNLSSYVINWNKAIDLAVRTHPGSIKSLSTCPTDLSKLLLLYGKGNVVLWNLQTKEAERFISDHPVSCIAWHHDGRQFICGTADGSLLVWNIRKGEFTQKLQPHGQKCNSINQIDWRHSADGEQLIIFSSEMPQEKDSIPSLTIMKASKSITVLELDHLITFAPLNTSPYSNVSQQPSAVAILMKHDLRIVDLTTPGYPCHENISPMDIHESRVRCIHYFSNCPLDLLGALALVGAKQRLQGFSDKPWPITGGCGRCCAMGHQELLLTGHEDGSIKFWQASGENLQILYKLKCGRHFERNDELELPEASHAVTMIELCLDSRLLLAAGQSGQLTLFRFVKTENTHEITVINIHPTVSSLSSDLEPNKAPPMRESKRKEMTVSVESNSTDTSEGSTHSGYFPLKVRGGVLRRLAGYQPDLVCMVPWRNASQPESITAIALNSAYGIIALGTSASLALVDFIQCTVICSWSNTDLYGQLNSTPILLKQSSSSSQYDPLIVSQQYKTTINASVPLQADVIYPGDVSAEYAPKADKTASPKVVKALSMHLRSSFKSPSRQKLFQHMTLNKTFHTRPTVANDKIKSVEAITTKDKEALACGPSSAHNLHINQYSSVETKDRNEMNGTSKRSKKMVRAVSEGSEDAQGVDANYLIDKIRVKRKTFVRSSALPTTESSTERFKSVSSSKITLDTRRNVDSTPIIVNTKPILRGNTENLRLCSDRRPQLIKSQSVVGSGFEINDSSTKGSSVDESQSSISSESVTSLMFILSFVNKKDSRAQLCLWVGTSWSTCIIYQLMLPVDRLNSTVSVTHSGTVVRTRGRMLYTTLMNRNFCLLEGAAKSYHEKEITKSNEDDGNNSEETNFPNKVLTKLSLSPTCSNATECSGEDEILQFAILVSEDEVYTVALPNFTSLFSYRPEFPLVKARATHVRGYPVLMLLNGAGQIVVLSLPSLRLLLCSNLFRHSVDYHDPMCFKTSFAEHGLGMYTITPAEIQKFTVCSELANQVQESSGELFVPIDVPEPPKSSFLKGMSTLFASQKDSFDLDAIFIDKNSNLIPGNSMRSVAKTTPASSNMAQATTRNISAGQAANVALQALNERAEKLNLTVDATERLRENAATLSQRTGKLIEKYEKKKWYNF